MISEVLVTESCPTLSDPIDYNLPMGFSRQEYGVGSHSLLQRIFPTQGSNSCTGRQVLYRLGHQRSPHDLGWWRNHPSQRIVIFFFNQLPVNTQTQVKKYSKSIWNSNYINQCSRSTLKQNCKVHIASSMDRQMTLELVRSGWNCIL